MRDPHALMRFRATIPLRLAATFVDVEAEQPLVA